MTDQEEEEEELSYTILRDKTLQRMNECVPRPSPYHVQPPKTGVESKEYSTEYNTESAAGPGMERDEEEEEDDDDTADSSDNIGRDGEEEDNDDGDDDDDDRDDDDDLVTIDDVADALDEEDVGSRRRIECDVGSGELEECRENGDDGCQ